MFIVFDNKSRKKAKFVFGRVPMANQRPPKITAIIERFVFGNGLGGFVYCFGGK